MGGVNFYVSIYRRNLKRAIKAAFSWEAHIVIINGFYCDGGFNNVN
jgi:hypothetical protein